MRTPSSQPATPSATGWKTGLRQVVNVVNLSTPLGLLLAAIGGAELTRGPAGSVLATSLRVPLRAGALTIGNVIMTRKTRSEVLARPALLRHELRHTTQYAWCLGPVMLLLYVVAAGWSLAVTGDPASRNVFERHAGLADGGYRERPVRRLRRSRRTEPEHRPD